MLFLSQGCFGLSFKMDRAQLWFDNGQDYRIDCFGLAVG